MKLKPGYFAIGLFVTAMLFCMPTAHAQEGKELRAEIVDVYTLPGIPSASGIEKKNDYYYVVGDDSPWMYEIDEDDYKLKRKFLIHDDAFEGMERIPSGDKPDYESIVDYEWGSKDLLVFGSGSGSKRKTMIRLDFTKRGYDVNAYTLEHLYNLIMDQGNITPDQLNIEGAVSWRDHLVLMNRETNHLILISKYAFERYMKYAPQKQARKRIDIDFYQFELPKIDGIEAQFSGGMRLKDEHTLVFSASVEKRIDPLVDGEILGSFMGLIALNKLGKRELKAAPVTMNGEVFVGKLEGVFIEEVVDDTIDLRAVTDNDQGASQLLKISLSR